MDFLLGEISLLPLVLIRSDLTGKPTAKILEDIDRDFFMSADEAKAYGLIDQVVAGGRENEKK